MVGKLIDAALMSPTFKLGRQERSYAGLRHLDSDQAGTQRDGVRVIVLASKHGRQRLRYLRAPARRVAVGGNRDSDSRSTDRNAALGPTFRQSRSEERAESRIIDAFMAVSSEVGDLVALLGEPAGELVLEIYAGMVGGDYDVHDC